MVPQPFIFPQTKATTTTTEVESCGAVLCKHNIKANYVEIEQGQDLNQWRKKWKGNIKLAMTAIEKVMIHIRSGGSRCNIRTGAKTINVFRAYLGAQLTICAQK